MELDGGRLDTGELPFHAADGRRGADVLPVDELLCTTSWLLRNAGTVRLLEVTGTLASRLPPLPTFAPGGGGGAPVRAA